MLPGSQAEEVAAQAYLLEEFLAQEAEAGALDLTLRPSKARAYVHGHCHQKAFGAMGALERVLKLVPDLEVTMIASSCCGMAGAFGYQAETYDIAMKMGELSLLPVARKAETEALIIANGTSCRQQIEHGADRVALHVARLLENVLPRGAANARSGSGASL